MRKSLCALLAVTAILFTGCAKTAPTLPAGPAAANSLPWPAGWPADEFPAPPAGTTITRTLEGGIGARVQVLLLDAPGAQEDTRAWLDAEAAKQGMQTQTNQDAVMGEINAWFSTPGVTVSAMWARQHEDKMWAVAQATEQNRPVMLYVKRQTSWAPLAMPADWPAELAALPKADPVSLFMDLRTKTRRVALYTKTPLADVQAAIEGGIVKNGFYQIVEGKPAWRKDGVTVVIMGGSAFDTTLIVEYTAH